MPEGKYTQVIAKLQPEAAVPGDIVHLDGRVLGRHEGIINYTIGQRRGIGVATGEPIYVVYLDSAKARVIVGPSEALATTKVHLRDVNWLGDIPLDELPEGGIPVFAKIRSTRPPIAALLRRDSNEMLVEFEDGESSVAPGQACAIFADDAAEARVLGGGFIHATGRAEEVEAALGALLATSSRPDVPATGTPMA